jgi:predicted nucleotidyltransferase
LGIERIGLFGSFARDEAGPQSDVDILVSLKKPSLFLYHTISEQLETVMGRKIDLVSAKSRFREDFLENMQKDLIYVTD